MDSAAKEIEAQWNLIFDQARRGAPGIVEVPMDDAQIAIVQNGSPATLIASRKLGSCSGIVVLGRGAAIMAHIAPRAPGLNSDVPTGEAHFRSIIDRVVGLFRTHRDHFPRQSTSWGVYVDGFRNVTDDLLAIATEKFAGLGIGHRVYYYEPYRGQDRRDQVRIAVAMRSDITTFTIESTLLDRIAFAGPPLPLRQASTFSSTLLNEAEYLIWLASTGRFGQMSKCTLYENIDTTHFTGGYDVLCIAKDGRKTWNTFNFTSQTW